MRTLLIFCCFFTSLFVSSCGDNKKSATKTAGQKQENTVEDSTVQVASQSILFFGNSLTAGYGLDPKDSFPSLIQQKIDSMGLDHTAINAGNSGETTAGGKNRISWVLDQDVDIFVLELGANDGLRGVPLSETRQNLQAIIDTVQKKNPQTKIVLAGMQLPPNLGQEYTQEFKEIFPDLAEANDVKLIPFLLEDVGGIASLNQSDGIHPTEEGQKIVARNVWSVLQPMLTDDDK